MSSSYKPGGGNKPQLYIPKGHGEKSGEYTNRKESQRNSVLNCYIKNVKFQYNFYHSKLVQAVTITCISKKGVSLQRLGKPNSVTKKIINSCIVSERYYNEKGEVYLDIDYTCHGNPKAHPCVPHIHRWVKDSTGRLVRDKWEVFQ